MATTSPDIIFREYLAIQFPGWGFEIEKLDGGVVNHTVRARRVERRNGDVALPKAPVSLVLKYAPPHLAQVIDSSPVPFSQERQQVEAAALRLFESGAPLSGLAKEAAVRIPRVVDHDITRAVLAIEDLGPLISLHEFFTPAVCDKLDTLALQELASKMGRKAGYFFAALHEPAVMDRISREASVAATLQSTITVPLVYDAAVRPIKNLLEDLGGLDASTAARLYARVEQDFLRVPETDEMCFQIGDCHPGCILVPEPTPASLHVTDPEVAVIDWEFATTKGGRGANGDMAQFLASMHLLIFSADRDSATYGAALAFTMAMCKAYAQRSPWPARLRKELMPTGPATTVLRSALILHGRELLNQLSWSNPQTRTEHMAAVAACAAWYLEKAGNDTLGMMRPNNWADLAEEPKHAHWPVMLALFGMDEWELGTPLTL